ncbi:MAG: aminotransferase class III-fold pyridoxal phosphate-dependent enzyme [Thermoleophilia bacterium]|nr:aminotransferase class III-fold pyridoxal phosphate-dependent enzyme [Thermoleophilia bacterium]
MRETTTTDSHEFPGFHLPGSPVFGGALDTSMFHGPLPAPTSVLDLAMVFGSRLWGHDLPLDADALGAAPGTGDLYTNELRERASTMLCERVARELHEDPDEWRALVLHTGSESVETALKTALRATARTQMVAYQGAYHGTFGLALAVTHDGRFRDSWAAQLPDTVQWASWGFVPALDADTACVIVEPWQGRAGVIPPKPGFLALLREECDRVGALLILDAVLCGAGRTGPTIAQELAEARPDIVCLGKAIGCGVTASAVVCRTGVAEDAWDRGPVEPAHTSTSLGDPLASAGIIAALHRLDMRKDELVQASRDWFSMLQPLARESRLQLRGIGMTWALDTRASGGGVELAHRLLDEHQILVVPSGPDGSSITIYPAVPTTDLERDRFAAAIRTLRP